MEIKSTYLPKVFFGFPQQIVHFVALPAFLFLFLILYKPFGLEQTLVFGKAGFAFNCSIIMAIEFLVMVISRFLLWGLRNATDFKRRTYLIWCLGEIVTSALFISMYVTLISKGEYVYIDVIPFVMIALSAICVFPYIILTLLFESDFMAKRGMTPDEEITKMRFYDDKHNLKFVADSKNILYIESHENYCCIYYTESGKVKSFMLRCTMKRLEEDCARHGIHRCHRSYFVNVRRIKILRKEREGYNVAELDMDGLENVPITPRYYQNIADMI